MSLIFIGLIYGMITCPNIKIINKSELPINDHDNRTMLLSKKRCKVHYGSRSCLISFTKVGYQNYYAVCSGSKFLGDL